MRTKDGIDVQLFATLTLNPLIYLMLIFIKKVDSFSISSAMSLEMIFFWESIRVYSSRHRGQNVETVDLIRAVEDVTGKNLRKLLMNGFNAGHPEFEISYIWHEDKKLTEWIILQKQTGGAASVTKDGSTTFLFHVPATLELTLASGEKMSYRVDRWVP